MAILRSQKCGSDCGPTCFSNALNLLGYDIKISKANKLCNLTKDGTDSDDLIRAFEKYGFCGEERSHYNEVNAWNWLIQVTEQGFPLILSVDDDGHWILTLRAGDKEVQIFDPDDDYPTKITRKQFILRWGFNENKKSRIKFHGIEFIPFRKKSIKATLIRERLLKTIDVR